jgi:hypothetical protein
MRYPSTEPRYDTLIQVNVRCLELRLHSAAPDALERAEVAAAPLEQKFRNNIQHSGVNGTWETCRGQTSPETVQRARATDLVVLAQPDPRSFGALRSCLLLEDLLMSAARPLLLVPHRLGRQPRGHPRPP